jgi:lysophospholipase L1-like esterase
VQILIAAVVTACGGGGGGTTPVGHDATLKTLAVSVGSLSPAFSSAVTSYALRVPNGTASLTVKPTANDTRATSIQVRQDAGAFATVAGGTDSAALGVPAVGSTSTITLRVTAEDGTTTATYTIAVTQDAPGSLSSDATLGALTISAGALSPDFSPSTTAYAVIVPNGTGGVTVRATAHDPHATSIQVKQDAGTFATVTSGADSASLAVPAVSSTSTITIRVTAEDGAASQDYTITLTQHAAVLSSDATLGGLAVTAATLGPAFSSGTTSYSATALNATVAVTVTPTAHDPKASKIQVDQNGNGFATVASGTASGLLAVPAVGAASSTITVRVTAEDGSTTQDYTVALSQAAVTPGFTVYTIGDSTMATNRPDELTKRGWGQMFPQFLTGNAVNAAINGRSTKSFYGEGSWAATRGQLKAGDYVFIQFAHNDEKNGGLEGVTGTANEVGTAPFPASNPPISAGDYQRYLRAYVDEARAAGATPILFTPIVRRYFSGASVTAKGMHDLTATADHDASITDGRSLDYVAAMKAVATEKGCALIDLTASTRTLVEGFGPIEATATIYNAGDDTHTGATGAMLFANLAVKGLIAADILTAYLNPASDLVVSPTTLDFGDLYVGLTQTRTISVTGLSLPNDTGHVTLTAPAGFALATAANGTFGPSLQLAYSGGMLTPTTIYVQFQPGAVQAYSGSVTVVPDAGTERDVAVSGAGVAAPIGGTESSAVWSLTANASCAATGLVTCGDDTFSELYAKSYAAPSGTTIWNPPESQPASPLTQRVSILNPTTPDQWTGPETAIVPTRYVQFAVSPAAGKAFNIDSITFWAGAAGGSNLAYWVQYSKHADFSDPTTLLQAPANATNTMTLQSLSPVITVADGETLYVRFLPWYKSSTAATGKYLCLQSVTIHGRAQ